MTLPLAFLDRPIAHRGLHDRDAGRIENGETAFRAAIEAGYGIELDVQASGDGVPVVFHDADLDRLTDETGPVRARSAAELSRIALGGGGDTIPTLERVLDLVAGRVPLLIEIKTQAESGEALARAMVECVLRARQVHDAPAAVMSFDPDLVAHLPLGIPRGITSMAASGYPADLSPEKRTALGRIADYERIGADFVSHDHRDLANSRLGDLAKTGATILCWTIRTPAEEASARRVAHNITFEGYRPA
ncbi:glycerophosphodiester phosphodiesterase family protein [Palleronia sp. LCG004]|uniref:glycerophosphodiester phosphodiesterase family protein n=1 Tax=Palleronia sp. LCG004 TaxID=3079304 RepID=UPI002941BBE3|nr:glycerophosphodiester phosphodiesterase family protein [Palleronia sp. LCG004]WOI56035.1 glycerophosphodiester phosphodiesterase family protein [Palleronia sp. LCG004]